MATLDQDSVRNTLVRSLAPELLTRIRTAFERVELSEGAVVAAAGCPIEHVFFPETALASVIDVISNRCRVEIGIVGYEGMIGWPILLHSPVSSHDVVIQGGGGTALRLQAETLNALCSAAPEAAVPFLRYINAFTVHIGRTAVSNLRDPVERRLSRWLLMCHDRMEGDEIDLTHQGLASMLGMRRASVTDGLHHLESESVIRNRRGRIVIRDRRGLQRLAGEGYGHAEAHYSRTIAPFGK